MGDKKDDNYGISNINVSAYRGTFFREMKQ